METISNCNWMKILIISALGLISITLHLLSRSDPHTVGKALVALREKASGIRIFGPINPVNLTAELNHTESVDQQMNDSITLPLTTTSTALPTTLDAAELLVERAPSPSRPYRISSFAITSVSDKCQ